MLPGEFKPPVSFAGRYARDVQDQSRAVRHLAVIVPSERFKPSHILRRNDRLMNEPIQLVESFNTLPFLPRQLLAFFADVNAMAAPAELFVRTGSAADSAKMSHAVWFRYS
jgi:hypothetical protein